MSHAGWGVKRFKQQNICGHPDAPHYAKGLCRACYRNTPAFQALRHAYYVANKPRFQEHGQRTKARRVRERLLYGITLAAYQALMQEQGGLCAICRRLPGKKGLGVDHCHRTGAVRALLCTGCNMAIGALKDNADLCRAAAAYLDRHHPLRPAPAATLAASTA